MIRISVDLAWCDMSNNEHKFLVTDCRSEKPVYTSVYINFDTRVPLDCGKIAAIYYIFPEDKEELIYQYCVENSIDFTILEEFAMIPEFADLFLRLKRFSPLA